MADTGYGSLFGIEGVTPGTYVPVAEVTSITPPGYSRDPVDTTHLTSPDAYKQFIAGLKESTDAQLTLNFEPSATDVMVTAFEDETGKYQITAPNGVRIQFAGFFTAYELGELTPDGKMTATATIKVSGKPVMVAAA